MDSVFGEDGVGIEGRVFSDGGDAAVAGFDEDGEGVVQLGVGGAEAWCLLWRELGGVFAVAGGVGSLYLGVSEVPDDAEQERRFGGGVQSGERTEERVPTEVADVAGVAVLHPGSVRDVVGLRGDGSFR